MSYRASENIFFQWIVNKLIIAINNANAAMIIAQSNKTSFMGAKILVGNRIPNKTNRPDPTAMEVEKIDFMIIQQI